MSSKDEKLAVPKFASFKPQQVVAATTDQASHAENESRALKAPKFSSFKPKDATPSRAEHPARDRDQSRDSRRSTHRKDGPHHSHARREEHRRDDDAARKRSRHDREDTSIASRPRPRPRPQQDSLPGVFIVDVKGDPLIRRYGESDRAQTSFYRRYGAGRVLGTNGRLVIHRDGPRDQFSLRMPGEGRPLAKDHGGLRSKRFRTTDQPVFLRSKTKHIVEDDSDDYLAVDESRRRNRGEEDTDSSEDDEPSYRSYHGQEKPKEASDTDDDSSPTIDVSSEQNNPLKWKSIQLNRTVKESPGNIDTWLELVNHQDVLLQAGQDIDGITTENEAHSYAEIKLSMLESALSNASKPDDKQRILVRLMQEGVKVWNTKVATKKWAEVVQDEEYSFELWKTHLDFAMSSITSFQYDDVKKMLVDRLHLVMARSMSTPLQTKFEEIIYVFLRLTCLLHDAGYKESAVAAWQCILDLNFFRPSNIESDKWAIDILGEFWETELPRIGEPEARGLSHYAETGQGEPVEPVNEQPSDTASSRDSYKAWGFIERSRSKKARMPARALDEGTDDDPFRVVIFTDIENLMFLIPETVLPSVAEQLIDAFLLFSGYPPAFKSSKWTDMAYNDQFIWRNTEDLEQETSWHSTGLDPDDAEVRPPPFDAKGLSIAAPPDLLFASTAWNKLFMTNADKYSVSMETVLNVTKQLVLKAKVEKLGCYHLALSFCHDPANVKKAAKALLKQYPTNASLYDAYAMAEVASGRLEIGSKVLSSAAEVPMTSGEVGSTLLWRSWSLMELENGNIAMATKRLCAAFDKTLRSPQDDIQVSRMQILKAHQTFSTKMEKSFVNRDLNGVGVYAEALALLAYLQGEGSNEPRSALQGDIAAAMSVFHAMTEEFQLRQIEDSIIHECTLQFGAKLLYLHACKGPFRRVYMREQLSLFLDVFPRNTIFLCLYEWSDSSIRVIDETRKMLSEKVLTLANDNVGSRVAAIRHELSRGNMHSAKAAFERAVSSDASKFNPWLWVSYIRFCRSQETLRKKAKEVFYRALRHCPWSKEVMLEAFATLAGDLGSDELKAVFNTMTSKGLRIHVDLEDYLAKRQAERHREEKRKR